MRDLTPALSVGQAVPPAQTRLCELRDLGRLDYGHALDLQRTLVEKRKQGLVPDQFLLVEHPHVITIGRNGKPAHLLASEDVLRRAGISFFPTDRGGDITYHGPGQLVGYPILDLREWKRDVVAYVRSIEQALIDTLADFGIAAGRETGMTGVWVQGRKIAAIGVHISRWITSHGFALNVTTDLRYFQYIVPCGLAKPVTSIAAELGAEPNRAEPAAAPPRAQPGIAPRRAEPGIVPPRAEPGMAPPRGQPGIAPPRAELIASLARHFAEQFGFEMAVTEEAL